MRLSLSPHNNGLQIPVGLFLSHFIAPLSHRYAPRGLVILSLGVSTGQFASAYILTNYERECADPLVFERGLARGRADPSDFEGGSAHTLIKLIDIEKDTKERVLTPWIDNLAFPQQAYRTKLWRCGEMCLSSHR